MRSRRLQSLALLAAFAAPAVASAQQVSLPPGRVAVSGLVYDSLARQPLGGALVQLVPADGSAPVATRTGLDGRYVIDGVSPGTYLIGFMHDAIDSLGLPDRTTRLSVTGDPVRVDLAIPGTRGFYRLLCGEDPRRDSVGVFFGNVLDASTRQPRTGATVRVAWKEFALDPLGLHWRDQGGSVTTADGAFAVCGIPAGAAFDVRVRVGSDSTGLVELAAPGHGILRRNVFVGPTRTVTVAADSVDSTLTGTIRLLRGEGALRGRITARNGLPVPNAIVTVRESGIVGRSREDGSFSLANLPTGSHTLEVRAIGYQPLARPVEIQPPGAGDAADVELGEFAVALDTVRIEARTTWVFGKLAEFAKRRMMGFGQFIDAAEIEKWKPQRLSDVLKGRQNVRVVFTQGENFVLLEKGASYCSPMIYLNGARIRASGWPIDALAEVDQIHGVEIYSRTSITPSDFKSPDNDCGAIVIWTGGPDAATANAKRR